MKAEKECWESGEVCLQAFFLRENFVGNPLRDKTSLISLRWIRLSVTLLICVSTLLNWLFVTASLWWRGWWLWWESKRKYLLVCVGIWYMVFRSVLFGVASNLNIQEWQWSIFFYFNGELNIRRYRINMLQKFINYRVVYDTKDVVYVACPYFWWFSKGSKSLAFIILHKNIGNDRWSAKPHGSPTNLTIKHFFKRKNCRIKTQFKSRHNISDR